MNMRESFNGVTLQQEQYATTAHYSRQQNPKNQGRITFWSYCVMGPIDTSITNYCHPLAYHQFLTVKTLELKTPLTQATQYREI